MTISTLIIRPTVADVAPGQDIASGMLRVGWDDLPERAQQWATEHGYGQPGVILNLATGDRTATGRRTLSDGRVVPVGVPYNIQHLPMLAIDLYVPPTPYEVRREPSDAELAQSLRRIDRIEQHR